uniref:DUF647 domain-containing protein n=1 Tax=Trichuris muris TaxID=70415 RepID=A0A5S6QD43_TRIMR
MGSVRFRGTLRVHEYYRSVRHSSYDIEEHGDGVLIDRIRKPTLYQRFILFIYAAFLPVGYPTSVTKDYMKYQIWDSLQAFCSSVTGALGMHSVFRAVGVGDEKASVLAASLTWLLRSGSGMFAQIIFAWFAGKHLDCDCKAWRLTADVLNDVGTTMELMAPYFDPFIMVIVCLSSICRAIVGLAGCASRAAISQHQALRNNLADVSAKDASQETLVNLIALVWNLFMLPMINKHRGVTGIVCIVFTIIHIYCNYKAVRSLRFPILNEKRFSLIVQSYLATGRVPNIEEVNLKESLWPSLFSFPFQGRLSLGSSISALLNKQTSWFYCTDSFILRSTSPFHQKRIDAVLALDCSTADMLEAAFYAEAWLIGYGKRRIISKNGRPEYIYKYSDNVNFHRFYSKLLSKRWCVNEHAFIVGDYRFTAMPLEALPHSPGVDEYPNGSLF